ncbi:heat shock factor protein 1-like isoform X1 [Nerophis ophidion]|uniref:heat shock factor protein 1-like isoform X1 n=1 Tax=Nerophis ophidion TaxID=159077 RepID=UPI002ADF271C|nr:heat shock factor protein 1-like isoform X1 [Nerophis ophidion]
MELVKGAAEASMLAGGNLSNVPAFNVSNVPAFLSKLWTLLEDPHTDHLICWNTTGTSFHVYDQGRFSKEVLPQFFKHNNMASFIRQLNMYGFRKVVHIEQGGLLKPEKDDTEFQHPFFIRGQEHLLENIKRKVTNVSTVRQEEVKISTNEVNKILNDVQVMKGKQETIDSRIIAMKHENEALWREMACLRQKHAQQQKVVNKLIQFLVTLVQSNRIMGVKRKLPLMLSDSSSAHSLPKYARPLSLEQSAEPPLTSGPIISDVTEVATPTAEEVVSDWMASGNRKKQSPKEAEPVSHDVVEEVVACVDTPLSPTVCVDTPLSPTAFINSILEEDDNMMVADSSVVLMDAPQTTAPNGQSPSSTSDLVPPCQTLACIDKSELSNHVETIDNSLGHLQNTLSNPTFTFETSPLMELVYPSWSPGDFDFNTLDSLLGEDTPRGCEQSNSAGKQLVQYTPVHIPEADLPSLLELEAEPFLNPETPVDDPTTKLTSDL